MKTCALISAYNEEGTAVAVVQETLKYVDKVIFADDGSTDRTFELIRSNFLKDRRVTIISWSKNRGKGYALIQGFKKFLKSDASILVTIDADGQHAPSQIPYIVLPIESGASDVVIGSRLTAEPKGRYPRTRIFFNIVSSIAVLLTTGGFHPDVASGFRAYSKDTIRKILPHIEIEDYAIELEILRAAALHLLRVASIPIMVRYDIGKKANFLQLSDAYLRFAWKYKNEIIRRILGIKKKKI